MSRALQLAEEGGIHKCTGGAFGAVIVKDGEIIGEGFNRVVGNCDPTAHAEVMAIRDACSKLNAFHLHGCDVYASNEPCPMCLAACYWARVSNIYYCGTKEHARQYGNFDDDIFYDELNKTPEEKSIKVIQLDEMLPELEKIWKMYQDKERVQY